MALDGNNVSSATKKFWKESQKESALRLYDLLMDELTTEGGANPEEALLLVALQRFIGIEDFTSAVFDLIGDIYAPADELDDREQVNREILANWARRWLRD